MQPDNKPQVDQPTLSPKQQQQAVSQENFSHPQGSPVQYVLMAESLKGVKGWLLFFLVCFALVGLGAVSTFFTSLDATGSSATKVVSLIFTPLIAVATIGTAVLISVQKRLGKIAAIGTIGLIALYGLVSQIVGYVTVEGRDDSIAQLVGAIVGNLIFSGLIALYFFVSKRVKETLVN